MSAVIESLKVRDFEGYKDEEMQFSAGLNLIKGRNSTGKSTILDALSYALFGEAPDVDKKLLVSRFPGNNKIAAQIKFRSPITKQTVVVEREGKLDEKGKYHNESLHLYVDQKEVPLQREEDLRAEITKLLGASFRQFMNLVYVRQGRLTSILEPPKPEQMDSILGITLLRELQAQFGETKTCLEKYEKNDVETEIHKLEDTIIPQYEQQLNDTKNEIPTLQDEVDQLQEGVKKAESEECRTLLEQIKDKTEMTSEVQKFKVRIQQHFDGTGTKTLDDLKAKHAQYVELYSSLEEPIKTQSMSRDQLRDAWTSAKSKKDTLDNDIDDREKLLLKGLAKCPNCGKKTSVSYTNAPLLADKNKISKLKTERTSCLEKHDTLEEQIKRDSKTRDTLHDSWTSLKVKAKLLEEEVVKHEKLLKQGKTTCPTCGQSISAKKFKTQLQTDRAEVSALKTQTKQAEDKFDTADAAISDLEKQRNDWLEKAKDVKTKIDAQESLLKQGFTKCDCGQTINGGKLKRQLQTDTESLKTLKTQTTQAKEKYDKAARAVSELEEKNREARTQAKTMKDSGDAIARYLKEQKRIAEKLESKISEIRGSLDTLGLQQLDPQDSAFERSLATIIPLDVDALEKKKDEFKKRAKLLREKTELHKGLTEKNEQAKDKLKTLKLRIQRAILARHLSEGFEQAIEDRRKDQLKRIEQLALQYYKGMTDQHTYTAITIDPENYRVFVHPKELTDRIPATRTGGGHQTLISIAIRLALLQELAFRPLLILDEPTYGVDDDNLPQLAQQLGQASKQLSQTIIVTHHGICEENATNILKIIVGQDGASHIQREGMDKSFLREGKSTPS